MKPNKNTQKLLLCYEQQNGYENSPQYHFISFLPKLFILVSYTNPTITSLRKQRNTNSSHSCESSIATCMMIALENYIA